MQKTPALALVVALQTFAALSVAGQESRPAAWHDRVAVIGWSLALGFGTDQEFGANVPLSLVLDQMIAAPHTAVSVDAGGDFFGDALGSGAKQIDAARKKKPTAVVAVDFPFWFLYGMSLTDRQRLDRLDRGLKLLDQFGSIPIVIGDVPDLDGEQSGLFSTQGVFRLDGSLLDAAGIRIRAFAKARPNVILVPLRAWSDSIRADKGTKVGSIVVPAGSRHMLMQEDGLHPKFPGLCVIAAAVLDALRSARPETHPAAVVPDPLPLIKKAVDLIRSRTKAPAPDRKPAPRTR